MTIETKPPDELMEQCDVVYASVMTSAALDAHCAGIPVITLQDGSDLNLSPLRGCQEVAYVSSPERLAGLVNNVFTEDRKVGWPEEYFYLDPRLSLWRKLLLSNTNL